MYENYLNIINNIHIIKLRKGNLSGKGYFR